jgi:hypothetical protein
MNGLERDDILRMVREVADKDKVDPVHNDMVTLTIDELGRLLAAATIRARGSDAA